MCARLTLAASCLQPSKSRAGQDCLPAPAPLRPAPQALGEVGTLVCAARAFKELVIPGQRSVSLGGAPVLLVWPWAAYSPSLGLRFAHL